MHICINFFLNYYYTPVFPDNNVEKEKNYGKTYFKEYLKILVRKERDEEKILSRLHHAFKG